MRDVKKLMVAMLVFVLAGAFAACGSSDDSTTASAGEESQPITGEFASAADIPAADSIVGGEAELERSDGGTTVSIALNGLEPKTAYIAHLHTGGCDQPDPGGPHFQFEKGGSEEPPNEIHLHFTSNAAGEGEAEATSKREVPVGEAGSVVLHVDESHHGMTSLETGETDAETIFVHEGVDHSKEGAGHPEGKPQHSHSDKIACAELEGAATAEGESSAGGSVPTIVVRDGEPVDGIAELEFSAGEEVRFRVSSDQAEEIHVHGYDISKDAPAGGTIEFAFPAELEGIYEAELEQLGVQIAELQINP
jgi:Cu-Zn family superoxide dismutase